MKSITLVTIIVAFVLGASAQETNKMPYAGMPPGMKGCYGTEQADVLKVFSAEEDGARFRAYHVKWQGQDVIVSDMFGTTDFHQGDTITFMVQNIEVPAGGRKLKMLQFMIMDHKAFMPPRESSNQAIDSDEKWPRFTRPFLARHCRRSVVSKSDLLAPPV